MARSFNGTSDKINPSGTVPDLTTNWTIASWFKRVRTADIGSDVGDPIYMRLTDSSTHRQIAIYVNCNAATHLNHIIVDVPFIANIIISSGTISDTNWHHVAVTRSSNTWTLYIDGAQDTQLTSATSQETGAPCDIGCYTFGGSFFKGTLTDVAAWSTNLSSGNITSLFNGVRPINVNSANLANWWPLDGYASPETDLINSNNGTLTGTAQALGPPPLWRISG